MEEKNEEIMNESEDILQEETEKNVTNTDEKAELTDEKSKKGGFFNKKGGKDEKLKEEIFKLQEEKNELHDKFLRLYSEFDNYKKRTQKEKLEIIETASERVIAEILPIVDDFERAIKANETVNDVAILKEGFELIYSKLEKILQKNDVESIAAIGEDFDTDHHEAIAHVPAQDGEKGKVIDVTEKGYKMKNKVIRYAKVVVGD